jgi:F-type H+-transporting ATPase subunit b
MTALASLGLSASHGSLAPASLLGAAGAVNIDFDLTFIAQMVVFALLMVVLKPLVFDPVLKLFEEREKRTDGAKADAREMQEKAGALLRKYETELEKVHQVAAQERDRIRAETARLEADQMHQARAVASKIIEDGRTRIQKESQAVKFELGQSSERLARDIASRVLGREVA